MLVKNQKVEMKWNNLTKRYYINKGYVYTYNSDVFVINAEDIQHTSSIKINVKCDYCGVENYISAVDYYKNTKNDSLKYSCKKCSGIKRNEYRDKSKYFNIFLNKCKECDCIPISTIDDYINAYSKLKFICPKHGLQEISYVSIYSGGWCDLCGFDSASKKLSLNTDEVIKRVESKNGNKLLNPEDYINHKASNLKILCGSCGNEFTTSLSSIENSDGACLKCANKKTGERSRLSPKEVKYRIDSVNGNILLNPEEYKDNHTPNLRIKCGECGDVFYTSLANYEYFQKIRCDKCSQKISIPERKTMEFLEKNNIFYKYNYTFNDCKDKRLLLFDFYLEKYNLIIEIDGEHHYHPKWGEEQFKMIKYHDGIKNKYCEDNEIKLLRIPFWNFENLEEIISEELKIENPKFSKILKMKYIPRYKYNKTNEYKIA